MSVRLCQRPILRATPQHGTGAIEPGLEADLIVVPGNPLEDIVALQDVVVVISNGRVAMKRLPFGMG